MSRIPTDAVVRVTTVHLYIALMADAPVPVVVDPPVERQAAPVTAISLTPLWAHTAFCQPYLTHPALDFLNDKIKPIR